MNVKPLFISSLLIAAIMAAFGWLTAQQLPADAVLTTQWGFDGQPKSTMPALQAALFPAGLTALLAVVFAVIPSIEPLQEKLRGSETVLKASWIGTLALMPLTQAVVCLPAWGIELSHAVVFLGVGALLLVIGNALPKSRPGFFVGIRTPWTITDTDIWIATHRLGGRLFMAAGAAIIIAALLPVPVEILGYVVLATVLTASLVPVVYSWWLWQSANKA